MATVVLRTSVWLILLGGSVALYWWKPLVLMVVGVLLAAILVISKLLGDLFWKEGITTRPHSVKLDELTGKLAGPRSGEQSEP